MSTASQCLFGAQQSGWSDYCWALQLRPSMFAFIMKKEVWPHLTPSTFQNLLPTLLSPINLNLEQIHSSSTSSDSLCSLSPQAFGICASPDWNVLEGSSTPFVCLTHSFLRLRSEIITSRSLLDPQFELGPLGWYGLSENQISLLCIAYGVYNCVFINGTICLIFVLPSPTNYRFHTNLLLNVLFLCFLIISSVSV